MVGTDRRAVRHRAFAARPAVAPYLSLDSLPSHSAEKLADDSAEAAARSIRTHDLCELDQTDRRRELRIFHCGRYAPSGLCVSQVRRYFENFFCQMVDAIKKATTAGNENPGAEIAEIRLLFQPAFEQLKSFAHAQVNDRVQGFPVDLFSGEP